MSNEQDRRTIFRLQDELRLAKEANAALQAENERLKLERDFYKCRGETDPELNTRLWVQFLEDLGKFSTK